MSEGFVKLNRGFEAEDLLREDPSAFLLLTWIALRARRTSAPNKYDLKPGEALIGDYDRIGMTRQAYRTALFNLRKCGYITTNPTNRGTVVSLMTTRIYDINGGDAPIKQPPAQPTNNHQPNQRATNEQPTNNQRTTTNKNERKKEWKNGSIPAPSAGEEEPSEHRQLIENWSDAFKAHFETAYGFCGGRDAKAVKDLLKLGGSPEAVMEIATAAWSNLSGFLHQHASTLHGLASKWNEITVAMKAGMKAATKIRTSMLPVGRPEDFTGGDITDQIRRGKT